MSGKLKTAEAVGSATPDPAKTQATTAPVPRPVVANKPAPGQRGPKGMQPRQTYSRVNTGAPPVPDAGMGPQKNSPIRGMEFLPAKVAGVKVNMTTMMQRPTLNGLVKAAMAGTLTKADINAEVARLSAGEGGEEKTASEIVEEDGAHLSTENIHKLASAVGFIADQMQKEAEGEGQQPGEGPGALQVMEATSSETNIDAGESGSATSGNQPPKSPPTQGEQVQTGKANTGLETNDDMQHGEQPTEPITNQKASIAPQKTASIAALVRGALKKQASGSAPVDLIRTKLAEDAINPAQISGGGTHDAAASPDGVSAAEEGKPPVPSDVSKQQNLVSSNERAISFTKRDAKADPKSDVNQVLSEPAQTSSTDKVLDKTLDHTDEAGAKISSVRASVVKTAAARALLSKLVKSAEEKKEEKKDDKGKKEKDSMGMSAPATPQSASGFTAGSM